MSDNNYHTSDKFYMEQHSSYMTERQLRRLRKKNGNVIDFTSEQAKLAAKTTNQQRLIDALSEYPQVVTFGPAGTGKTYVTTAFATDLLVAKKINKIVLTRPNIPAGPTIGLFPGSLEEKMEPWVAPLKQIIKERSGPLYEYIIKPEKGVIEIIPFEVMRGRSFDDTFILLDEAQNTTIEQMKCLLTRTGENSHLVINGDLRQKDLKQSSGLEFLLRTVEKNESLKQYISVVEFNSDDIVRSDICKAWIQAFDRE